MATCAIGSELEHLQELTRVRASRRAANYSGSGCRGSGCRQPLHMTASEHVETPVERPASRGVEARAMSDLPSCPKCQSGLTYEDGNLLVCPECAHEWSAAAAAPVAAPEDP